MFYFVLISTKNVLLRVGAILIFLHYLLSFSLSSVDF